MIAGNLQCEYMTNPCGIDVVKPALFWTCGGGMEQTAYQIEAFSDGRMIWDTGKTASSRMTLVMWNGAPLRSRERVLWKVKLWDEQNREGNWSAEASFEMGLLSPDDWAARWIAGNYRVNPKKRYPVDCFRKSFEADPEDLVAARVYATACGVYEGQLNGSRIGTFCLAPGVTDYRHRVQVQTIDVLHLLTKGTNEMTFELADGWFRGATGAHGLRNQYGTQTRLLVQLELLHRDGRREIIGTDKTWEWSNDGPIRFADNKDGEIVDACMTPTYGGHAVESGWKAERTASDNVPVTEHEHFRPSLLTTPSGKLVLDFGQNIAGYIAFRMTGTEGQRLDLRFGEMLDAAGEFTQANIQCVTGKHISPLQEIHYHFRSGENCYKTKFAVFGFQYALVSGDEALLQEIRDSIRDGAPCIEAIAVYSDMAVTFDFDSSNELLNRFVQNTIWSQKNNSLDIPTDCPTRERHGWTGDAQIFCVTGNILMNYVAFSRKFERDLTDWQAGNRKGMFPQIAPAGGVDPYMRAMDGSVGWADAGVMIPYRLWKLTGDRRILLDNYEAMKRYAQFCAGRCGRSALLAPLPRLSAEGKRYVVNEGQSYGEWAEPEDVKPFSWKEFVFPHPEVSTAYTSYVMTLMTEIAQELGKSGDVPFYQQYAEGTRRAYQELVSTSAFSLDTDRQACLVRPLYFHLLTPEQEAFARKRLVEAMEHYGWRVGTGFLSTPLILDVLESIDPEDAYKLLENEEMPGWLFMPKVGACTIWESWEGTKAQTGVASLDHYSKGACCEWIARRMCGLAVEGERRFRIAPQPGGHFTFAGGTWRSLYGTVSCRWKKAEDGSYQYDITVPANTTARVCLPGQEEMELKAGTYQF